MADAETVTIHVDGRALRVVAGTVLAGVLWNVGMTRPSVTGSPRAPVCGMGSCWECRAWISDMGLTRTCLVPVRDGMVVTLDG
jgi:sarcosine oxidase subunit alpha